MGRIIAKKVRGMNWMAKISLVLVFTLVFSTFMYQGWYSPKPAAAAITALQAWANVYHGTATTAQNIAYTVPAGSGTSRLLVVAISTSRTTVGSRTVTLTYGGQTLTSVTGDMATTAIQQHTQLYYLNEAGLDAATNTTLSVTVSSGTTRMTDVFAAVFDGVNQTAPIRNSQTYNSGTTAVTNPVFGTALTVNAGDQAVEIINCTRTGSTTLRTITYATNWTMQQEQTSTATDAIRNAVANRSIPGTNTTDTSSTTFSGTALASMTAMSLNSTPSCTDPDPATLTTTNPTSSSTVSGTVTVQTQVGVETAPSGMTGMVVNITGSTGCNVTNGAMTWNAGSSRWEYSWNTAACGATTPDTGVSITVSGTDPDCGTAVSAAAVTNVTIDNGKLPSTVTSCAGCHDYSPTFTDSAVRNTPAGQFPGSHKPHVQDNSMVCSVCHVVPATETSANFAHRNGTIQMRSPINGNTGAAYTKGTSFAQTNTPTAFTSCTNTSCHGSSSPIWGANTTDAACVKCHGIATSTPAQFTADTQRAAPGYTAASAPVGPGRSTGGATAATDAKVGAHDVHLRGTDNMSSAIACVECHNNVNTTNASFTGHMNGVGNLDWGTLATTAGKTPGYTAPNCTSVYCHTGNRPAGTGAGQGGLSTVTAWTNTALIGNTSVTDTCINKCHEMPPRGGVAGDSHSGLTAPGTYTTPASLAACSSNAPGTGCHPTINGAPTSMATLFFDKTQHINGSVEGGSCVGCHSQVQTGTHGTPRDQITGTGGEFGLAWGHKKSGRGAVTDADCIVCHLEGNFTTGNPTAYHKDGNIDLRDPDGAGETPITNNSGGAFTFTKFSISYAAGSRTSAISNSVADVITQKFCLACHDSNGATNPTARTSGGTAAMPFGGIALGTNYTAATDAIGTQGLIDVKKQFALTNSSRHPVLGPRLRDFPYSTRLAAPYNNIGTARDANGTTGHATANSVVMNCFDCHTTSALPTTRTIVSHGNAETLRGTSYVASPTLCLACHIASGTNQYGGNTQNHGTGSAWAATGSSHGTSVMAPCHNCHGSNTNTTKPARPRPAQDYHGSNALASGGLWPTVNSRPYAFIRGWSGTAYHRPYRASEFTTGSATCGAGTCPGGGQVGDGSNRTYTPGGTY